MPLFSSGGEERGLEMPKLCPEARPSLSRCSPRYQHRCALRPAGAAAPLLRRDRRTRVLSARLGSGHSARPGGVPGPVVTRLGSGELWRGLEREWTQERVPQKAAPPNTTPGRQPHGDTGSCSVNMESNDTQQPHPRREAGQHRTRGQSLQARGAQSQHEMQPSLRLAAKARRWVPTLLLKSEVGLSTAPQDGPTGPYRPETPFSRPGPGGRWMRAQARPGF